MRLQFHIFGHKTLKQKNDQVFQADGSKPRSIGEPRYIEELRKEQKGNPAMATQEYRDSRKQIP